MKLLIILLALATSRVLGPLIWNAHVPFLRSFIPRPRKKGVTKSTAQTHHPPSPLPYGENTLASWAKRPAGRLVVFVHGFGGHATGTWNEFPRLLLRRAAFQHCDIVFYGYDSTYTRADINAQRLNSFLHDRITSPTIIVNALLEAEAQRPQTFCYENVFIVAHSLGAIVSRRALLNANREKALWPDKVGLILFAPAHMGANIQELVMPAVMGIPFFGPIVSGIGKWRFQSLQDLEPRCFTLQQLHEHTTAALANRNGRCHIARKVIHASKDRVVHPHTFCDDPPLKIFEGRNHMDICKPSGVFLAPLDELRDVLIESQGP